MPSFTPSNTILGALGLFGKVVLTLLYVFSIAATYRLLILTRHIMVAYILTGIAIVVPYSGLITTPIALGIFKYMELQPAKVVSLK
jgi:hypothetical protein